MKLSNDSENRGASPDEIAAHTAANPVAGIGQAANNRRDTAGYKSRCLPVLLVFAAGVTLLPLQIEAAKATASRAAPKDERLPAKLDPKIAALMAQDRVTSVDWMIRPWRMHTPAFKIADNLYYVGNNYFSSHLVVGTKGMALIDTPEKEQAYLLVEGIRSLGLDPFKIKYILHTHWHYDHIGSSRRIMELYGAKAGMGEADIEEMKRFPDIESLWQTVRGKTLPYVELFDVALPLKDGDTIDLGGTVIHAYHTPGHTPGTITFTFDVQIDGKTYKAGLPAGPGVNFLTEENKVRYPAAPYDFEKSLDYQAKLNIEVWIGSHPFVNNTVEKYERLIKGEKPNPFIDPDGLRRSIENIRKNLHRKMAETNWPPPPAK